MVFFWLKGVVLAQRMVWVNAKGMFFFAHVMVQVQGITSIGPRDDFSPYGMVLAQWIVVVQGMVILLKNGFWSQEFFEPKGWF